MKWMTLACLGVLVLMKICAAEDATLTVSSVLAPPFLMEKSGRKDGSPLVGNNRYEGYALDLTASIAKMLGIQFVIRLTNDGKFGSKMENGTWNGMIGDLIKGNADAAVGPLTITSTRERVVDFSKPFMSTGITMITKKTELPFDEAFGHRMYLLLQPFKAGVWIVIIIAFVLTSVIVGLIERGTTKSEESVVSNVADGCWWTIQALTLQGFFRGPSSTGSKVVLAFWFGFSIITVSMYISSLSNRLTAEGNFIQNHAAGVRPDVISKQSNIKSVDDLVNQRKVKYGAILGGATYDFFRISRIPVYEKAHAWMSNNAMPSDVAEGIKRVKDSNGDFVFFSDSVLADYHIGRECELTRIGGNLNSVGYGIATSLGSKYREKISLAILELRENGELQKLMKKWWFDRGVCEGQSARVVVAHDRDLLVARKIDLKQFAGVAVLLVFGILLGVVFAAVNLFRKKSKDKPAEETALNGKEESLNLEASREGDTVLDQALC